MSSPSRETNVCAKRNESGPDYLGYYKHLVSNIFSQEDVLLTRIDSKASVETFFKGTVEGICNHDKGIKVNSSGGSVSLFSGGIGEGLSEFKKERLKAILDQSATCINQEVDEVLNHIMAVFHIESDFREKELSYYSSGAYEDIMKPLCAGKRKASPPIASNPICYDGTPHSQSLRQVYQNIQALQGNGEVCSEAVEKYSTELCSQLGKMEQDLEEYLNIVVANSRPMTPAEKFKLGQQIKKLPNKALDRVVELVQLRDLSARNSSGDFRVNLEDQDNITLWRLYYYVETVMKANKF